MAGEKENKIVLAIPCVVCYTLGMTTALLTICLLYLLALRHTDRTQRIDKRIVWLRQDIGCYLLEI